MSGIRIPDELAESLEREWQRRLEARERGETPAVVAEDTIERWREYWDQARADAAWLDRQRVRDVKRREILPQIRDLIVEFLQGHVSLSDFRETFDHKTRNEWDLFGLKGMSGAMFLNKLVKYLPDQEEITEKLQQAVHVPSSEADAREKLHGLMKYLDEQIEAGVATGAGLQPNRAPFFVSACWHVQDPERWPIIYQSARMALQDESLLGATVKGADGYLEFTRVFRALAEGLELPFWDVEHLCVRKESGPAGPDGEDDGEEEDEASQKERIWLIAPGAKGKLFDQFYEEGIIAIGWEFLGDLSRYDSLDAMNEAIREHRGGKINPYQTALACHQFAQPSTASSQMRRDPAAPSS